MRAQSASRILCCAQNIRGRSRRSGTEGHDERAQHVKKEDTEPGALRSTPHVRPLTRSRHLQRDEA